MIFFSCREGRAAPDRQREGIADGGFSLFEVVLAIGIASIVVVVAVRFGAVLSSFGTAIGNQTQTGQEAILGFQVFTTDIRAMNVSSLGAYPLESTATSSLIFYSDVDQDGLFERVRYFFGTSTLQRGIIKPTGNPFVYATSSEIVTTAIQRVAVSKSIFDYFDSSYTGSQNPLTSPIDTLAVRIIRPTIVITVGTATSSRQMTFMQTITIRNLRSN